MNRLLIIVATLTMIQCMYCRDYYCDSIRHQYIHYGAPFERQKKPPYNVYDVYTYAVVKDTFLMDLIIDKVNYVLENDSICNLIKNEYFHDWNRNIKRKYCAISVGCKNGLPLDYNDINEKFIPAGFDRNILYEKLLTISVMLSYYYRPTIYKFYTNYKDEIYFFGNTLLINPTSKEKRYLAPTDYDVTHMYDFIELQFFYYKGELYLDPTINTWHCYQ